MIAPHLLPREGQTRSVLDISEPQQTRHRLSVQSYLNFARWLQSMATKTKTHWEERPEKCIFPNLHGGARACRKMSAVWTVFSESLQGPEGLSEGSWGPWREAGGLPGPQDPELRPEGPCNDSGNTVYTALIFSRKGLRVSWEWTFVNFWVHFHPALKPKPHPFHSFLGKWMKKWTYII